MGEKKMNYEEKGRENIVLCFLAVSLCFRFCSSRLFHLFFFRLFIAPWRLCVNQRPGSDVFSTTHRVVVSVTIVGIKVAGNLSGNNIHELMAEFEFC